MLGRRSSVSVQTEEFMSLIPYQEQLTKLYMKMKSMADQNKQLAAKLEYVLFKNSILEESALGFQKQTTAQHSVKNDKIFHDLIQLQEEIVKEHQHSELPAETSSISKLCSQQSIELSLSRNLTEQAEISFLSKNSSKLSEQLASKENINQHQQMTKRTQIKGDKKGKDMEQLEQRIAELEQRVKRSEKERRVMVIDNKRMRKMNETYVQKIRKLEKISEGKSILLRNREDEA